MPVIATQQLTKRYPRVTALDGLSLEVGDGVTGLVGANGAGKSTLIKILLGLSDPTSGSAQVLGHDVRDDGAALRSRVGYMPEHDCLPADVSATELVVHLARMSGLPTDAARERAADTLRHVGLYEERYRPIGGYSTGMKLRVKLAQALVHDPDVVFLDEPTNGLDPAGRDEMLGLVRRIYDDFGISVLVTSHLLGELERICDQVVIVDGGVLLRSSTVADFTRASAQLAVEVAHDTAGAAAALAAAGLRVSREGETLLVELGAGPGADSDAGAVHDTVRDVVADGYGLVRLESRRHHIAEVFDPTTTGPAGATGLTSDQGATDDAA
ncbi:ABC transporter ATP-binding protein [Isoptericola cucumis]|uniref:ABC transporter ATP-binding protein n=1 Tax=Isoptericola cucumis TaxID=1776856 RepID=UPI00320AE61A